jgi:hypothetical protein
MSDDNSKPFAFIPAEPAATIDPVKAGEALEKAFQEFRAAHPDMTEAQAKAAWQEAGAA